MKAVNNLISLKEIKLGEDPYEIEIPVKLHERVRISGYVRTSPEEKRDAAIIYFDLGDHIMDAQLLKSYGLQQSKIGIYRYLPVGKEFEIWTVDVFIPAKINSIKVGFRTWKNKEDVIIGVDLNIHKDFAYSKIYKELLQCEKEKEASETPE